MSAVEGVDLGDAELRVWAGEVDLEGVVVPDGDQVLRHLGCSFR
jgi:hypothetical protein